MLNVLGITSNHGYNSAHSAAVASYPPPPPQAAGQMMQHSAAAADYFRDAAGQLVTYIVIKFKV